MKLDLHGTDYQSTNLTSIPNSPSLRWIRLRKEYRSKSYYGYTEERPLQLELENQFCHRQSNNDTKKKGYDTSLFVL